MMEDLTVTLVQTDLAWENPQVNRKMFTEKLDQINSPTDLIILPEMFTTGFTLNAPQFAEPHMATTFQWMAEQADKKNADIIGSIIVTEQNRYYNRLYWVRKDGSSVFYDKRHLFRMADEHKVFSAGKERIIGILKGWKILPLVCYDLRFPVWARGPQKDYDLIIYIANWPESRSSHWRLLLAARAVENQAYGIGVNRIGKDGTGKLYRGDSAIFDPLGNIIHLETYNDIIITETLSYEKLKRYRSKFPVWMDSDSFKIIKKNGR
jgi:predicted amidohydrolase